MLGKCCAGDYVKTKRALIRAVEKQAEMEERMDLLKARQLSLLSEIFYMTQICAVTCAC